MLTSFSESPKDVVIHGEFHVVVTHAAFGQVTVDGVVTRLADSESVFCQRLHKGKHSVSNLTRIKLNKNTHTVKPSLDDLKADDFYCFNNNSYENNAQTVTHKNITYIRLTSRFVSRNRVLSQMRPVSFC